jgi:hypothetical protein
VLELNLHDESKLLPSNFLCNFLKHINMFVKVYMTGTLLSCMYSSDMPPNEIVYSTKGQLHDYQISTHAQYYLFLRSSQRYIHETSMVEVFPKYVHNVRAFI